MSKAIQELNQFGGLFHFAERNDVSPEFVTDLFDSINAVWQTGDIHPRTFWRLVSLMAQGALLLDIESGGGNE